jgi:pyruvate dehydrogenase E2 component (dihydrolipoamide acetyltransferase)
MAQRITLAWQIPHVTAFDEVDISRLADLRQQFQPLAEQQGVKLTYLPFILKAVIQTLKEQPDFNAWFDPAGPAITRHPAVHLGIAVATPDGLLVPVIRHAEQLNLRQLAAELARLTGLAEQRRLNQTELGGSTFTVSNFGSLGLYQGTPLINPPEVAILGCGRIEEKPVVAEDQVVISPVLPLSLSFDHRWLDGAAAAAFLTRLKALLANPNLLFWELV